MNNNKIKDKPFWIHWNMSANEIIKTTNKMIIKSIKTNEELINYKLESNENLYNFLSILSDDMTEFQIFHSMCGFLQYISPNEKIRKASLHADLLLSKYINELNLKKNLYKKIVIFKKIAEDRNLLTLIDKKFINKLI